MNANYALVLQGGAMRCMFTTGVLDAFMEEDLLFPYIVGVSAGATNGIAFLARDKGHTCRANLRYIRDPRFMGFGSYRKTGSYFNFDFMYRKLPHDLDPFDYDTFFKSESEMEIGATNCATGEVDYFSFQEAKQSDSFPTFLQALCASCSVPCLCKPVLIKGNDYLDGGIGSPIPYDRALEQGYDHQVVILTQPLAHVHRTRIRSLPPRWTYRSTYPAIAIQCRHYDAIYNQAVADLMEGQEQGRFTILAPDAKYMVRLAERSRKKLIRLYEHGYEKGLRFAKAKKNREP